MQSFLILFWILIVESEIFSWFMNFLYLMRFTNIVDRFYWTWYMLSVCCNIWNMTFQKIEERLNAYHWSKVPKGIITIQKTSLNHCTMKTLTEWGNIFIWWQVCLKIRTILPHPEKMKFYIKVGSHITRSCHFMILLKECITRSHLPVSFVFILKHERVSAFSVPSLCV